MKRAAMAAMAILAAAAAQAQPPARTQPPRLPTPVPAQAAPQIPTRVAARTLTALCGEDRSACLTYVLGSADAFASALAAAGRPQVFCVPRGTTNDQIAQAAVRYLRAHPEEANNNAALVILAGLQASFPCGY
ncbi:MAG TPA: Rap1a/Tai family immunity protein [Allosphingosinicella sp.]|nr:Rap1a/Tai family immunity protein [Allosphingosinicella sp.]